MFIYNVFKIFSLVGVFKIPGVLGVCRSVVEDTFRNPNLIQEPHCLCYSASSTMLSRGRESGIVKGHVILEGRCAAYCCCCMDYTEIGCQPQGQ